jgi:hypothetical protein
MNNESNPNNEARLEAPKVYVWQLDPSENYSDWKLEIETAGGGRIVTYHVHRFILSVGERKSRYFERLLKTRALLKMRRAQVASSSPRALQS